MAEIPVSVLPRLQTWWAGQEGGTQAIFEAIYMEAPAAVSRAVSGGEWVADGPEPGLAAQLAADHQGMIDSDQQIPRLWTAAQIEVTPFHAQVGQKVAFKWTESNSAKAALGKYFSDIYVTDPDGQQVGGARLEGAGVPAEGSVERTWEFSGGATKGSYNVVVYMNSEGSDPGSGVPGPQGYRGATSAQFDVGGGEGAADTQDSAAWGSSMAALQAASAYADMPGAGLPNLVDRLREGVNWLAAVDGLTPPEQDIAGQFGTWVESIARRTYEADEDEQFRATVSTSLATVGGIAARVTWGGTPEARQPLFDALKTLARIE